MALGNGFLEHRELPLAPWDAGTELLSSPIFSPNPFALKCSWPGFHPSAERPSLCSALPLIIILTDSSIEDPPAMIHTKYLVLSKNGYIKRIQGGTISASHDTYQVQCTNFGMCHVLNLHRNIVCSRGGGLNLAEKNRSRYIQEGVLHFLCIIELKQ
jgi:hypothetical protein